MKDVAHSDELRITRMIRFETKLVVKGEREHYCSCVQCSLKISVPDMLIFSSSLVTMGWSIWLCC